MSKISVIIEDVYFDINYTYTRSESGDMTNQPIDDECIIERVKCGEFDFTNLFLEYENLMDEAIKYILTHERDN
jgi:hypothetical protein